MTKYVTTLNFTDVFTAADYLLEKNVVKNKAVARLAKIRIQIFLICFLLKVITSQNNYKYSI